MLEPLPAPWPPEAARIADGPVSDADGPPAAVEPASDGDPHPGTNAERDALVEPRSAGPSLMAPSAGWPPGTTSAIGSAPSPAAPLVPLRDRWAAHELGELLARAGAEGDAAQPFRSAAGGEGTPTEPGAGAAFPGPPWMPAALSGDDTVVGGGARQSAAGDPPTVPAAGGWEVDRLPSEAEGGIMGLLLGGTHAAPTGCGWPTAAEIRVAAPDDLAPPWRGALGPAWGPVTEPDAHATGRARLTEMLEHLPAEPAHRLTPDDVEVDQPLLAPPVVWFWGDDDIYPGKLAGVVDQGANRGRRRRRKA